MQHQPSRSGERSGDRGRTSLPSGARLEKDSPAIEVLGAIDELDSWISVVLALASRLSVRDAFSRVRNDLSGLEARIGSSRATAFSQSCLARIDSILEALKAEAQTSGEPVLPGGSPSSAFAHVARSVCRRAERRLCRYTELAAAAGATCEGTVDPAPAEDCGLAYLNRLSELLLVAASLESRAAERPQAD